MGHHARMQVAAGKEPFDHHGIGAPGVVHDPGQFGQMVRRHLGVALVPELALRHRPAGVVVLDVPEIRLARNVFALLINEKKTARVQLFVDLLAETLAGLGAAGN